MAIIVFRDVSSPFRVNGSDVDLELVLANPIWKLATAVLSTVGIGSFKRSKTYRIALGNVELFLLDSSDLDETTLALQHNLAVMQAWNSDTAALYLKCKAQLDFLTGTQRKAYKAALCGMFGLNPIVYA